MITAIGTLVSAIATFTASLIALKNNSIKIKLCKVDSLKKQYNVMITNVGHRSVNIMYYGLIQGKLKVISSNEKDEFPKKLGLDECCTLTITDYHLSKIYSTDCHKSIYLLVKVTAGKQYKLKLIDSKKLPNILSYKCSINSNIVSEDSFITEKKY